VVVLWLVAAGDLADCEICVDAVDVMSVGVLRRAWVCMYSQQAGCVDCETPCQVADGRFCG
jgi:hypothetical protein